MTTQASQASVGYLSTFSIGDNASPTGWTEMAELKSIKPNIATIPSIETTHLKSPLGTEEKLPGLIKPGTVDITGNFIGDSSQLAILTKAETRAVFPFKITAPIQSATKTYTCIGNGFISKYENGPFEHSRLTEFSMSMEITGFVTETVA
jgi:hypothetical protein